jgi:predicted nucleic-acid-binding Zn-ribbon protein
MFAFVKNVFYFVRKNMDTSCPKCGSHDLHAEKRGVSGTSIVYDAETKNSFGLMRDIDRGNEIIITCLACGYQFYPGKDHRPANPPTPSWMYKLTKVASIVAGSIFLLIALIIFSESTTGGIVFLIIGGLFILYGIKYKVPKAK